MDNTSLSQVRFRFKYIFAFFAMVVAGLVLLIISLNIVVDPVAHAGSFKKLLCEQLATAMLVGAFTGALYEYFLRKEFIDSTVQQTNTICTDIKQLGTAAELRSERIADFFVANTEQRELGISHCYKELIVLISPTLSKPQKT